MSEPEVAANAPLTPAAALELLRGQSVSDPPAGQPAPNGQDAPEGEPPADVWPADEPPPSSPPDQPPAPAQTFKVQINGEEREVSLNDLLSGYQQGQDYTKKTQSLAQERQQFSQEAAQLEQMRQQMLSVLEQTQPALEQQLGP